MRRLLLLLDALPRRLRWALFLPVGIGCSFMLQGVVHLAFGIAGPAYRTTPGVIETVVTTFVAGVTLTLLPAVLSPRPWPVGLVMFTLGLVLRVSAVAYLLISAPYLRSRANAVVIAIAANTLGGCLGLYLIRHVLREKSDTPAERAGTPGGESSWPSSSS